MPLKKLFQRHWRNTPCRRGPLPCPMVTNFSTPYTAHKTVYGNTKKGTSSWYSFGDTDVQIAHLCLQNYTS